MTQTRLQKSFHIIQFTYYAEYSIVKLFELHHTEGHQWIWCPGGGVNCSRNLKDSEGELWIWKSQSDWRASSADWTFRDKGQGWERVKGLCFGFVEVTTPTYTRTRAHSFSHSVTLSCLLRAGSSSAALLMALRIAASLYLCFLMVRSHSVDVLQIYKYIIASNLILE